MTKLKCVNEFGNVDLTRQKLGKRYVHVKGKRLQPLCRKLGIKFAEAIVGFDEYRSRCYSPIKDGVVVSARSAPKLLAAIAARDERTLQRTQDSVRNLDVLAALFTLNRRAKRCRDLARKYYDAGMHGLAGAMRHEKERIYRLKGQALHYLAEEGRLGISGFQRFDDDNWSELLAGDGYSFHRPCAAQSGEVQVRDDIEAKPKGAKEPTMAVAFEVVERFLEGKPQVSVFQWPRRVRVRYEREADEYDEFNEDIFDDEEGASDQSKD